MALWDEGGEGVSWVLLHISKLFCLPFGYKFLKPLEAALSILQFFSHADFPPRKQFCAS